MGSNRIMTRKGSDDDAMVHKLTKKVLNINDSILTLRINVRDTEQERVKCTFCCDATKHQFSNKIVGVVVDGCGDTGG